ncbi:MAG: type II toxin-antitoxin system RelE/ParE family toxin [Cyanobacteria bacterium P01_F01_bin.143]
MTVILLSPKAEDDLEHINDRVASYNPQAANKLLDKILDKFEILASFPQMGKNRNELVEGLRSFPIEDYLIFYFPVENGIEIARVVSGYRDLEFMFNQEER